MEIRIIEVPYDENADPVAQDIDPGSTNPEVDRAIKNYNEGRNGTIEEDDKENQGSSNKLKGVIKGLATWSAGEVMSNSLDAINIGKEVIGDASKIGGAFAINWVIGIIETLKTGIDKAINYSKETRELTMKKEKWNVDS